MCLEMCFLKNSSRINQSVELNEKKSNEEDFDATYAISPLFFFEMPRREYSIRKKKEEKREGRGRDKTSIEAH